MPSVILRPYQVAGYEKALKLGRLAFAHTMGAGKTYIELALLQEINPERALFIVPAIVRPMWLTLLREHMPHRNIGSIRFGRNTKAPSKALEKEKQDAYAAPYQVVSYDLVSDVDDAGWNRITCDEGDALRNPMSIQSKEVKRRYRANPKATGTVLSGTLIPNEAWQIWNPLDTLFPGWAGKSRIGDVPWAFKERYCNMELRHGHPYFHGLKNAEELKERIAPFTDRVVTADFADYLPELFVEALRSDLPKLRIPANWLNSLDETITHRGIFTHLRETANAIAAELQKKHTVFLITGAETAEVRARLLQEARESTRCVIVGTTHALAKGVSLSFLKAGLIFEWTTELDGLLQFIGRFARQDSTSNAPTRVDLLIGANDEDRMATLRERLASANALFKAGRAEALGASVLAEQRMTEDAWQAALDALMAKANKHAAVRGLIDGDDDSDTE